MIVQPESIDNNSIVITTWWKSWDFVCGYCHHTVKGKWAAFGQPKCPVCKNRNDMNSEYGMVA